MKNISLYLILLIATITFACKKEKPAPPPSQDDNQKPVVTFQAPDDASSHLGGQPLTIQVLVTDNIALSQYKLEIHSAADGHTHGKTQSSTPFAWDTVVNVGGTSTNPTITIDIPATVAAGPYHLTAQAIDAAGFASDLVIRTLTLVNPSDTVPPGISGLSSPDTTGGEVHIHFMSVSADTTFNVTCTLSDNIRLSGYRLQVIKEEGAHKTLSGGEPIVIYEISNTNLSTLTYSLNVPITFRNTDFAIDAGHHEYALLITAIDHVNNRTNLEIPLHVDAFP